MPGKRENDDDDRYMSVDWLTFLLSLSLFLLPFTMLFPSDFHPSNISLNIFSFYASRLGATVVIRLIHSVRFL